MKKTSFSNVFYPKRKLSKLLLIMKLATLFSIVFSFNIAASVYSQNTVFTMDLKGKTVREVFQILEQQSKFRFFYNDEFSYIDQIVNLDVKNENVEQILKKIFASSDITYKVLDNNLVVLTLKSNLQQATIKGKITDGATGEALPGVNVIIKGTTRGTTSDMEGNYTIDVNAGETLVFSYVGYLNQEVAVGNQSTMDIQLAADVQKIDEIIVVGYGVQKKSSVTGAITPISAKEITQLPVSNVESALQGLAAGVSVVNNGSPGTQPIVRIRGNGSISLNASPLYVVDGFPTSDISSFDNKDIESLEVLKDASASAIYGSRAANGVVLVTTKKAKKDGKAHFNFESYAGVQMVAKQLDLLNTEQYPEYARGFGPLPVNLRDSAFNTPIYAGATTTYAQTNTDWQDAIFRNAMINQNSLSFSVGGERSSFYGSAGYFKQDGILLGTSYERLNFRLNSDHKITKWLTVGHTAFYSTSMKDNEKENQGRTVVMHAIRSAPTLPVYDPTKLGGYRGASAIDGQDADNPVKLLEFYENTTGTKKLFGTIFAEIAFTDFLKFRSTAGLDYINLTNSSRVPIFFDGRNGSNTATLSKERFETITTLFSHQLTFDKKLGDHYLNIVAVAEQQPSSTNNMFITGSLATNDVKQLSGLSGINANGSLQENTLISYLGRVNYDFKNKYILSAALRYDGSSKFATGKKWGAFPSVSVGWRISEEAFMDNMEAISELKLRGGFGLVGFNGIGNYDPQVVISNASQYVLNNGTVDGSFYSAVVNKDLTWEKSQMTNIGLDLSLFQNKITFSAEYFNKLTSDLILGIQPPRSTGITTAVNTNIAEMRNSGMEFSLGYHIAAGDFKSSITANVSIIQNKVLKLNTTTATYDAGNHPDFSSYDITRTVEGQSIQQFYGWETDGIFQNETEIASAPVQVNRSFVEGSTTVLDNGTGTSPGDIRFKDISGPNGIPDNKIDGYDRKFLGSYMPDFTFGLNYSGSYKNLDFSLFIQGVSGNKIYNGTKVLTQGMLRLFNAGTDVLNAWKKEGDVTDVPRIVGGDPNQNTRPSDRFIEDGSYIRLKSFTIGFTIPSKFINSLLKESTLGIRLYISGQNLITLTKYSGYDPEIGSRIPLTANGAPGTANLLTNGIDYGFMPAARSFIGGLQINF